MRKIAVASWLVAVLSCVCQGADAPPPLLFQDFENFSLESLPSGWKKENAGNLSLVNVPDHGMCLKVVNKAGQSSGLVFRFDASQVQGKILNVKADAKLLSGYETVAGKNWAAPKIMGYSKPAEDKPRRLNLKVAQGTSEWKALEGRFIVPEKTNLVTLSCIIEEVAGEVLFDNIQVEFVGGSKPFKDDAPIAPPQPPAKEGEGTISVPGLSDKPATDDKKALEKIKSPAKKDKQEVPENE